MYRLSLFFRLCRNLERIVVLSYFKNEYIESLSMDAVFLEELSKCMDIVDESGNDSFTEIVIVKPIDSIGAFTAENAERFKRRGWSMAQRAYSNPERPGSVDKALYIQRDGQ